MAKKGMAGKNTGPKAKKAIKVKRKQGATLDRIAKAAKRSVDTISDIQSGKIKNPPSDVVKRIRALKIK